jgi:hypothetical protein
LNPCILFSGGAPYQAVLKELDVDSPLVLRAAEVVKVASHPFIDETDSNVDHTRFLPVHSLEKLTGELCRCEIKVSHHDESSSVAIIRNVTERYQRFEAEERAHSEALQRQGDAQVVSRFTRHEVNNGLLAGIELCDSLRNIFEEIEQRFERRQNRYQIGAKTISSAESSRRAINDMDGMMHEVLDTVLTETMARDIIHEIYSPRLERLDVKGLLTSINVGLDNNERFPLEVNGVLPYLMLDQRLLRYIHSNALSNACKYGKRHGRVLTVVEFDEAMQLLEMQVINEPGIGHEERKY